MSTVYIKEFHRLTLTYNANAGGSIPFTTEKWKVDVDVGVITAQIFTIREEENKGHIQNNRTRWWMKRRRTQKKK